MIKSGDTSSYNGNATLNDAALQGDVEAVRRLAADASLWNRQRAAGHAANQRQTEALWVLLDADIGEEGRGQVLETAVLYGEESWVERLLADGTTEKARGCALNKAAEWKRYLDDGHSFTSDQDRLACVRLLLAAGTTADAREYAREKATAHGDTTLVPLLA